jgi:signal transduction histidine kinase
MAILRFDDSLETVLSGDMSSPIGAELAWRQLVDLIGRGRVAASETVIARLRILRGSVPPPVRSASARAVATAAPPLALVMLFAEDEIAISAPILRSATLAPADWAELLPLLSPTGRSILRHRRDLPGAVVAMLESFGTVDFVLAGPPGSEPNAPAPEDGVPDPSPPPPPSTVAELHDAIIPPDASSPRAEPANGRFEVAELLARLEAYQRSRAAAGQATPDRHSPDAADEPRQFRFETDQDGTIRWIDGVSRTAVVGISLARAAVSGDRERSGVATAAVLAFRERAAFTNLALTVAGESDAAGAWRISAVPVFDRSTGGFTGFRGAARRAHDDESVEPSDASRGAVADALRQLVHELRTPTNAIAGFAEMIETEMLGPVPETYRTRATAIRTETTELIAAIDAVDTAARAETAVARLGTRNVPVAAMLDRIATGLAPQAIRRGATIAIHPSDPQDCIRGDARAVERLIERLLAMLVGAAQPREQISVTVARPMAGAIRMTFARPRGMGDFATDPSASPDGDSADAAAPLLGTGFALRLTHNVAAQMGGSLTIAADSLTLELPAAFADELRPGSPG